MRTKWLQLLKIYHKDHSLLKQKIPRYMLMGVGAGLGASILTTPTNYSDTNYRLITSGSFRFLRSVRIGLTISLDYYFSMAGLTEGTPNYDVMMSRIHQRCAERIREGCLHNGGTYIKMGQGLVSLSHILPKEYIETMKVLHDKCLIREKDELYQIFQEDFGKKPEELFCSFDATPIAAASIAQVFKAVTKDGQEVAVKVQYKDLQKRFHGDLATVQILLIIGTWFHPKVDFTWLLEDIRNALSQELDFVHEGHNSERCARDLKQLKYVYVPPVLWDYTNTRVLVTEFVDAYKITDLKVLKDNGFSIAEIDNKVFETFGKQIFETGFVHADPHPGNVMIRRRNGKTEIVILDHGLYQEVSEKDRIALSHMWKAIVLGDHKAMKNYSTILGVNDYVKFAEVLTLEPLKTKKFKLSVKRSEEDFRIMQESVAKHFDQITLCLRQMPRSLLLVIRNMAILRSISNEHGDVVDRYTILARMATRALFKQNTNITQRMVTTTSKLWFEIMLLVNRIILLGRSLLLDVLYKLRLTGDIKSMIKDMSKDVLVV